MSEPTVHINDPVAGTITPVEMGYGHLEFTFPNGDVFQVDLEPDGVVIRNSGRRMSSGLAILPRVHNSVKVIPSP